MTQRIDPVKLKAAAEHLEWVLMQYPNEAVVQDMLEGLRPFIEAAKAWHVLEPIQQIPFGYQFGDYVYWEFKKPSVEDAYIEFRTQLRGGRTEQEQTLIAEISAYRRSAHGDGCQ